MKILLVNKYFFSKGGSETLFFGQARLLQEKGDEVCFFSMHHPRNQPDRCAPHFLPFVDYDRSGSAVERLKTAGRLLYSRLAQKKLEALIQQEKPDLAHLHNIHHQISPSILPVLKKHHVPVVMTLHDYKMVCPVYTLFRDGKVCEDCSGGNYFRCLQHRCTKGSLSKSLLNTVEMYLHHSLLNLYRHVDVFISPSGFLAAKAVEMGFKPIIRQMPNFIVDMDNVSPAYSWEKRAVAYFGRLSPEKGIPVLFQALKGLDLECWIFGEGPERPRLESMVQNEGLKNIHFFGHLERKELHQQLKNAMFVVLPSLWYENYPYAAAEAFALGKPIIASHIGGLPELVRENHTGMTFEPGKVDDLRRKILHMVENSEKISAMGKRAREYAEKKLSRESHYQSLLNIYTELLIPKT